METDRISQKYLSMRYEAGLPRINAERIQEALSDAYGYARTITKQTGVDIESTLLIVLADFVNEDEVTAAREMKKMASDIPLFTGALPLLLNPLVN